MGRSLKVVFIVAAVLLCGGAFAQKRHRHTEGADAEAKSGHSVVWRKRVTRNIYLPMKNDKARGAICNEANASFLKKLVDDAGTGVLKGYEDFGCTMPFTKQKMGELVATKYDTAIVEVDPVTLADIELGTVKTSKTEFDYGKLSQFRLCEEWVYYMASGTTEIRITAVAPGVDIYADEGEFRGTKAMFWIKWEDLGKYLQDTALANRIGKLIWADYFRDSGILKSPVYQGMGRIVNNVWEGTAMRKIKILADTFTNSQDPNLIDNYDSSITGLLYDAAYAGLVKAYSAGDLNNLTAESLKQLITSKVDTVVADDPVTGLETARIIHHDLCFECVYKYYVEEQWEFDIMKGFARINYVSLSPVEEMVNDEGRFIGDVPLFWVNYADVRRVLTTYNEYNPRYNIEWQVWADRFNEPKRRRPMPE